MTTSRGRDGGTRDGGGRDGGGRAYGDLRRTRSSVSLLAADGALIGPLSGPSDPAWRRQRLLGIGTERGRTAADDDDDDDDAPPTEHTALHTSYPDTYGALTLHARRSRSRRALRRFPTLQDIVIPKSRPSNPPSSSVNSPTPSFFRASRPVSAYDRSAFDAKQDPDDANNDVKTNGIRVWYSSFTSVDWLHDAIKDSARRSRLRKHRSLRGKAHRQVDRSVGWVIVSIVGFLTAVVAFLIVRGEQLLFDLKEGYCVRGWYKAKRFCCPSVDTSAVPPAFVTMFAQEAPCEDWRTWAEVFMPRVDGSGWLPLEAEMVEYLSYTIIAVRPSHFSRVFRSSSDIAAYSCVSP